MNWHGVTLTTMVLAVVGCGSDRSTLAAGALPALPPTSRSQKPEPAAEPVPPPVPEGEVAVQIRAVVGGIPILDDELRQATYQQLVGLANLPEPERSTRQRAVVRAELDKLIERELILNDALAKLGKRPQALDKLREAAAKEFDKQLRSMKERARAQGLPVDTDEEFAAVLAQQGLTVDSLQRQSERSFMAMEYMRHLIYPSIEKMGHNQIRQYYDEHPGEFQSEDRVKWQDIFIAAAKYPTPAEARQRAEEIAARARKGEEFLELSKKYDDGDSGLYRAGAGLGERHGEIKPLQVEPILFRMREGEIGPIVELETGCHIIRLVEREYAGLHPLDGAMQQQIKKKLQGIIADREYHRIIDDLKRKATVEIVEVEH
jgi:peptidyl-prolyl cis-trans isomerase SurA